MADQLSSSSSLSPFPNLRKPNKQSDSSTILSGLAKTFSIKKISRILIKNNNKPVETEKESKEKYSETNVSYDLKSINRYSIPSFDADELEHYLFRFQWQSNFSSPMEQRLLSGGVRVLDIGCGTGAWVLDMAKEYPSTNTYVGIDILPNFPNDNYRFSNTGFIQWNVLDVGIPFPDSVFDFVYERFVCLDLTDQQWNKLFSEMIRVLKPGGYLEIMEHSVGYENPGPITKNRNSQYLRYLNSKGIDPETTMKSIPQSFQSSKHLTDFHKQEMVSPIGRWGGEFGLMMLNCYEINQKALNKKHQPSLSKEVVDDIIATSAREFDEYKTKLGNFRCFARKIKY